MEFLNPKNLTRIEDLKPVYKEKKPLVTLRGILCKIGKPTARTAGFDQKRDLSWLWRMLDRGKLPLNCMFQR